MTVTAEPIWRPMWNEFPDNINVYDINSQFMVGNSILFAPKVLLGLGRNLGRESNDVEV